MSNKNNIVAFGLGLAAGYLGVRLLIHGTYLLVIILLVLKLKGIV